MDEVKVIIIGYETSLNKQKVKVGNLIVNSNYKLPTLMIGFARLYLEKKQSD